MTFHSSSVLTCGSAGLCLNTDIWGSISLQWHPGGPMCLERRLFVQARSCIANGSRRTLQPHVAARSGRLLHLQHREGPDEPNCGSLWMKTSPDQRFTMQATDVYKGVFPYTDSAYSWQWIHKVSSFDTSLHLQPLTDLFLNRKWINDEMGKKGLMSYLWVKSLDIMSLQSRGCVCVEKHETRQAGYKMQCKPWGLVCWTCGWWRGCWSVWWLPSFCPMFAGRSSLQVQRSAKTLSWFTAPVQLEKTERRSIYLG